MLLLRPMGVVVLGLAFVLPSPVLGEEARRQASAGADTLSITLEQARDRALADNPAVAASIGRWRAALGDLRQARAFPFNPNLELESSSSLTTSSVGEYEARIQQEIPIAGQWGRSVDVARAYASQTRWTALDEARELLRDVELAFARAVAAERRLQVSQEIRQLNDSLQSAVEAQLREGEVSALEASLTGIETARSRARVLTARREVTEALLEFARLLGLPTEQEISLVADETPGGPGPSTSAEAALRRASERRPDILAADQGVLAAAAMQSLAVRQAVPNPVITGIAERVESGQPSRFGIGIALPLPLFDRRQGDRARSAAELLAVEKNREALRLRLQSEVVIALRGVALAREEVATLANDVLAPARANQGLLEMAYREGKIDLSALLLLRNQLLDAQLSYWDAWRRWQEAETEVRAATGTILEDYDLPEESGR